MVGLGYYRVSNNGNPLVNLLPFLLCSLSISITLLARIIVNKIKKIVVLDKMGVNSSGWIY